jgi:hypothetical protein
MYGRGCEELPEVRARREFPHRTVLPHVEPIAHPLQPVGLEELFWIGDHDSYVQALLGGSESREGEVKEVSSYARMWWRGLSREASTTWRGVTTGLRQRGVDDG